MFLLLPPLLLTAAGNGALSPQEPGQIRLSYLAENAPRRPVCDLAAQLRNVGRRHFPEETGRTLRPASEMTQFDATVADFQEAAPDQSAALARYLDFDRRARAGAPPELPDSLPGEVLEFYLYSLGWSELGQTPPGELPPAWDRLMRQPEGLRRYHTVKIHYIQGNRLAAAAPEKALEEYRKLRRACAEGFSDRMNLERASFAANARYPVETLKRLRYLVLATAAGLEFDVDEFAALLRRAFYSDETRRMLGDPLLREVALLGLAELRSMPSPGKALTLRPAGDPPLPSADRIALFCYFRGEGSACRRLLAEISEEAPLRLYLEARLLLEDGKSGAAAEKLLRALDVSAQTEEWEPPRFARRADGADADAVDFADEIHGLLGRIAVERGEFETALRHFLQAGSFYDAAVVAEQLLTTAELAAFCRESGENGDMAVWLRHLLARRLFRAGHPRAAAEWLPAQHRPTLELYCRFRNIADDPYRSPDDRACGFVNLGTLMLRHGFDLAATELHPDYHLLDGQYPNHPADSWRSLPAMRQVARRPAEAEFRFHYRLTAAHFYGRAGAMFADPDLRAAAFLLAGRSLDRRFSPVLAEEYYHLLCDQRPAPLAERAAALGWFPRRVPDCKLPLNVAEFRHLHDTILNQEQNDGSAR